MFQAKAVLGSWLFRLDKVLEQVLDGGDGNFVRILQIKRHSGIQSVLTPTCPFVAGTLGISGEAQSLIGHLLVVSLGSKV